MFFQKFLIILLVLNIIFGLVNATNFVRNTAGPWAGYIATDYYNAPATTYNFTSINGSWIVQAALPTNGSSYGSQWIGLGGFQNSGINQHALLQIGTQSNYVCLVLNFDCSNSYDAFYETLGTSLNPSTQLISGLNIRPGDKIFTSITLTSSSNCIIKFFSCWKLFINDSTKGESISPIYVNFYPNTTSAACP